ncbi:hypothetical protein SPSIL_040600 [Sporomusa silvacetica DSM 10669]|uniref:Uncharacterized protein n=1 Tax=Sporomusa silvacetica DSM 10669 TaxID=1123289 RepID=A0ABZ3IQ55_9FIRM|nr:hypothetical protein SPSIL_33430 [Sporomusa silvacetica DSM 10669]
MTATEVLKYYQYVVPILTELLPNNFCVPREKYLVTKPSKKINLNIAPGTLLKDGTSVFIAMAENRRVVVRADIICGGVFPAPLNR